MKNTIQLSGIISYEYFTFQTIKLIQQDEYKIDLVSRFREAIESFGMCNCQVSYWLADKRCSKNKMTEELLNKISGSLAANYEKSDYQYSSWTSGTDYDTILKIGGHDLMEELRSQNGRFIIIELNFKS